jgi:hypothetical protein
VSLAQQEVGVHENLGNVALNGISHLGQAGAPELRYSFESRRTVVFLHFWGSAGPGRVVPRSMALESGIRSRD